jgi:hypothetical protein
MAAEELAQSPFAARSHDRSADPARCRNPDPTATGGLLALERENHHVSSNCAGSISVDPAVLLALPEPIPLRQAVPGVTPQSACDPCVGVH